MIKVRLEGVEHLKRILASGSKQVRFATAVALTRTSKGLQQDLGQELASRLESASPYTRNSTFSTGAKPANLQAVVGIKDKKPSRGTSPATILKEHFTGGRRGNKPFEVALMAMGVMPKGYRAITASGIKTDAYGNPTRAAIGELLGGLKSRMNIVGKASKRKGATTVGYFAIQPGARSHLAPGVYKRINMRAIQPMLVFVPAAGYARRFHLPKLADRYVSRHFQPLFEAAYAQAVATAR